MKKTTLLKTMLLLCALVVGSMNSWATDVVFDPTKDIGTGSSVTKGGITITASSGTMANGTDYRPYSGATLTISSSVGKITGISFTSKGGDKEKISQLGSPNVGTWSSTTTSGTWSGNADEIVFAASSAQVRILGITVTYTSAYTITAQSNDNELGTVSLSGSVITGSPKSGCRYASPAYTVSSGSATVAQDGNAFTVTPSSNCTITINFEAIPTHTLSTAVSPAASGIVTLGSTTVKEGSTTTATAAAEAGYKFTNWSISGTGATLSSTTDNPTTVTMGTADATITANFEAVTTHAITYSVNGNNTIVNVEENAAVDLSAPASGIPAGYSFIGWRTSTLAATNIDPNDYVTSATSTADITYYAVIAVQTASLPDTYEKLASNSFDTKATYVIGAAQGGTGGDGSTIMYFDSYDSIDEDISWGSCTSTPSTVTPVYFTLSGTAAELVARDNSGNYLTCISAKKFAMSSTLTTVYLHTDGSIKSASEGNLLRYNHNNGSGGLRWYASSTGAQAYFYKVIKNSTYANYCTSLPASVEITPAKTYTTLTCANPLDFTDVSSDLKAFIATEIADSKVQMTQVNKVPANTGLVLKATTTGSPISVPVLTGSADDVSGNKMAGSAFSSTSIAANGGYILKDGVFQPASAGTLAAGKAYLNIAIAPGAHPLEMSFDDGEVTSIECLDAATTKAIGVYYNLAGQRVVQPTKGLYIMNGKKVIIK